MRVALTIPVVPAIPVPEIGIASLAGRVRARHVVRVFDANAFAATEGLFWRELLEFAPQVIGVSAPYSVHRAAYRDFVSDLRRHFPGTFLLVGGNHATNQPAELLGPKCADGVVIGEGEETLSAILAAIDGGKDWRAEPGLAVVENGCLKATPRRPPIEELDSLPFPAFDLLPMRFYERAERRYPAMLYRGRLASWILRERGCPYGCTYCASATVFGKKVRWHGLEYLQRLIAQRRAEYALDHVYFLDDVFTFDRSRTVAFCRSLIDHQDDLVWGCQTRVDRVDAELLALMKESGCALVEYGVETLDEELLKTIRKGASAAQTVSAIEETAKKGISMQLNFMLGLAGQSASSSRDSIEFGRMALRDLNALPCYWSNALLPGTHLHRIAGGSLPLDGTASSMSPEPRGVANDDQVRDAWTQNAEHVDTWFRGNRLLLAALRHYDLDVGEYLSRLFPSGIGNFHESHFFISDFSPIEMRELGYGN
jgi:anaerobic magnesium-protoporphyrin IX monomethyl ester cyclase